MPLINCKITLDLNWSENCVVLATYIAAQAKTFSINDTKLYVLVVTLLTEDNAKLSEQLKSGLKEQLTRINMKKKYQKKE